MSFSKRLPNKIITKAQKGNKLALMQIYQEYKSAIFGLAFRILQDRDASEEVLHQVVEKLMVKLPTLQQPEKFNGWLKTLSYRTAIDAIKSKSREVSLDAVEGQPSELYGEQAVTSFDVEKYLATLDKRERLVVMMFLVEGFTHQEVAAELDITEANSKQIYRRALNKLKQLASKEAYSGVAKG